MQFFQVHTYTSPKPRMILPKSFQTKNVNVTTIHFGKRQVEATCLFHQDENDAIYLSTSVLRHFNLTHQNQLYAIIRDHLMELFYPFGVFTAGLDRKDSFFHSHQPLIKEMIQTGNDLGFHTFFFGYQDVDPETNTIHGLSWGNQQWTSAFYPIPTAIYNRIPNRKVETHSKVQATKKFLQTRSLMFNPDFFNKWQIYDILIKHAKSNYLLPYTILHPSIATIQEWADQKPFYLKPVHGSKGDGIYFIRPSGDRICVKHYEQSRQYEKYYQDIESLQQSLFPNGFSAFVLQEGINVMRVGGQPIDFRIHTNKDATNQWQVSFICVKHATNEAFTTHVNKGGHFLTLADVFTKQEVTRVEQKLINVTLMISNILERQLQGPIGELGFDIGIDQEQKLWLFEVNAKPGWSVLQEAEFRHDASKIFSYLYQYASHLIKQHSFILKK
ncbi:hypothetical protein J416_14727 [Gracilibacillus halophilus YIM-C55.5]|uniref:ATP-grasp domain-containing protein n=1 Tax=Gracilibacillus halophilus YIM-C55.5 TaxID=1308866 RepID=N4WMH2_9BACI|nr:YheC/YheD family protein [Gracilibacillus halophilus]ENH95720.1 hypothetical protein J416_14727 [Gracilibacillus halophilus YIM-C55.5]